MIHVQKNKKTSVQRVCVIIAHAMCDYFTEGENLVPERLPQCISASQKETINVAFGVKPDDWISQDGVERLESYPTFTIEHGVVVTPSIRFDGKDAHTTTDDLLEIVDDVLTLEALVDEARRPQKDAKTELQLLSHFMKIVPQWVDDNTCIFYLTKRTTIGVHIISKTVVYFSLHHSREFEMLTSSFIISNNQIWSTFNMFIKDT